MQAQSGAWQMEALSLLHQLRSKNADRRAGIQAGHGVNCNPEVNQMCHGNSPTRPVGREVRTIAERARESIFERLLDILCQIIAVEEDIYAQVSRDNKLLPKCPKDSIELKNICLRMASSMNSPTDRDLRDLQTCLKCITNNLLFMCNENGSCIIFVTEKVKRICDTFPEMW
ncbi:hypothetical protein ACEWY4_016406 [Coilia grayii]|uniref:Uncharacterized protein n=1 Tax=Coilia grayii TaxID=363190 RepID=A0ABD1JK80_9TELE